MSAKPDPGQPLVGILVGNSNHLPQMQQAGAILERLGVSFELRVMSPHRSPDLVDEYARTAEERGIITIICGAAGSGAGGLAGAVAARTALPVIGVPIASETLGGADALYSAVQMPRGVPVGTMAINGAVNAAVYAAQIVAVVHPEVRARMHEFKDSLDEGMRA
ncbi:MAG TPA: 5-(carboxyamino)imidazole ribonucleotide mutase [Actinomycetota bacterium]|nr:5-(carboxyamino)imidazole ribonucleotide mutase [Actinomycetota bacterium]